MTREQSQEKLERKPSAEDNWTGSYLVRHVEGREGRAVEYLKEHRGIVFEGASALRYLCIYGDNELIEGLVEHPLFESVEKEGYSRTLEDEHHA